MTKRADVREVAVHFVDWLKELAAGHELVVMENDRPVARLVAAEPETKASSEDICISDWFREHARDARPKLPGAIRQSDLADELFGDR